MLPSYDPAWYGQGTTLPSAAPVHGQVTRFAKPLAQVHAPGGARSKQTQPGSSAIWFASRTIERWLGAAVTSVLAWPALAMLLTGNIFSYAESARIHELVDFEFLRAFAIFLVRIICLFFKMTERSVE